MEDSSQSLSGRIKALRHSLSLSQAKLAEAVDVTRVTVSYWEMGTTVPQGENLARLAEFLGTTPRELLWGGTLPSESAQDEAPLETLGNRIKALRLSQSLSQSDVGASVGVSKASVSQWELGFAVPRGEHLVRLANCLGTTPAALWGDASHLNMPLNEELLTMAISCLEVGVGESFTRLAPSKKAKLILYLYNRGEPLPKQELVALLALIA
jgi:transcriptional regulator with XRE-family HTH domain